MRSVQVLRRGVDRVPEDPRSFWLARLDADTFTMDAKDPHPLDPKPEHTFTLLIKAQEAIRRAEQEGRTNGLDTVREKLGRKKRHGHASRDQGRLHSLPRL